MSEKRSPQRLVSSLFVLLVMGLVLLALLGDRVFPSPAITAALWWAIAGTLVLAVIAWGMRRSGSGDGKWEDIMQGAAAAVTVVAIFIASGIYFLERKDRAKIQFEVSASRALLPVASRRGSPPPPDRRTVLLGIRVLITNISARRLEVRCIMLGLFRPVDTWGVTRNKGTLEEISLQAIDELIPYHQDDGNPHHAEDRQQITRCLQAEVGHTGGRPFFMWGPLRLEPSEGDDRYFEYALPCRYPFIRVLVKIRINPGDEDVYESKVIIPVDDVCEGRGSGMARSVTPEGPSQAGEAAPTEQESRPAQ